MSVSGVSIHAFIISWDVHWLHWDMGACCRYPEAPTATEGLYVLRLRNGRYLFICLGSDRREMQNHLGATIPWFRVHVVVRVAIFHIIVQFGQLVVFLMMGRINGSVRGFWLASA